MFKKHSALQTPLLNAVQISECVQAGRSWNELGLPGTLRHSLRISHQGSAGDVVSFRQGSGIDFSETRPYQAGDEPRNINWRATARTGRPMVRVFHEDLSPQCYFLIDRRASMCFGTRERLKVTQAVRLAIFLASREAQKGSELGALILNQTPQWQAPVRGERGVYQLAESAGRSCLSLSEASSSFNSFSLKQGLSLLIQRIPAGSHVYLISDFYDMQDDVISQLYQLSQQQCVWALGVYDEAERQLPDAGNLKLMWGEKNNTDNIQLTDTCNETVKTKYHSEFLNKQQKIKSLFDKAGIDYNTVSSRDNNLAHALQVAE